MGDVLISGLDADNPLYLHSNDLSNLPIVNVKLTRSKNYKMWSTTMSIALTSKNKMGFVDGTCVKPATSVEELQETYDKMDGSVIFNIIYKINGLKQGDMSVLDYYHKLNSLWREFDTLTLLHTCTCAAHEGVLKHNQLVRLIQFLMGLNDVYQNIRSNILAREPFSDVKEAFNVISMEESHRGLHHGSGSGNKVQPAVFVAKTNNFIGNDFRRGNNGNGPMGPNPNLLCKNCGLIGHTIERCYEIIGLNLNVGHPNETLAKITAIGNLRLSANVVLFDVLVVPEYCVSLMSVHKLIKDSKLFVVFDEHKCYIQDLNLVKTVGIGIESGGLYLFDEDQIGESKYGLSNSIFVCNVSKQLWHNRLSHPSDQVLSILSKSMELKYGNHISPCDIYHKAKQTREPFPFSDHKYVSIGDPVHLDLWGPYRVVSRDGYKYFLTVVVDDFSRAMWDYLIKSKDEVEKGIIHQTSCAHTPQQNSIVERKHRQLLNVTRGLMLPSSVLSGSSPYMLVYGNEPSLSHIRCFACLCNATVLNNHDEFIYRAKDYFYVMVIEEEVGDEEKWSVMDVLVKLETSLEVLAFFGDAAARKERTREHGAPCTQRKNSKVLFRRPCILSWADSISPKGFLSPILLWVVIMVVVVIVIVRVVVVEIIKIITAVAIIHIVVAFDGVSSIFKLSFTIIGFLYRIMLEYLIH
ncbi:ribonuclease H-like domain-containing protein [Tanacetum coccineum]